MSKPEHAYNTLAEEEIVGSTNSYQIRIHSPQKKPHYLTEEILPTSNISSNKSVPPP